MKLLTEFVEISSGSPQFRITESFDKTANTYKYLDQEDIENSLNGIKKKTSESKSIRTEDEVNVTHTGDVIFSLISGTATLISEQYDGYLYTQNYLKMVPNKTIDKKYLIYLLNEDVSIKKQLHVSLQGSEVMKYTIKQIRELELNNIPPITKQVLIGKIYFNQICLMTLKKRKIELENKILLEKLQRSVG